MTRREAQYQPSLWSRLLLLLGTLLLVPVGVVAAYLILGDKPGASRQLAAPPMAQAAAAPSATSGPPAKAAPAAEAQAPGEKIEDWMLFCPAAAPGAAKCYIQQQLRTADGQKVVFVWTLRRDSKGIVHSAWQAPIGVVLSRGMIADIGDGKPRTVPFGPCGAKACVVQAVLAPGYLQALLASSNVSATVSLAGDKPVRFPLSSRGLAEGLSRLPAQD
ncbi:MAG: hypothetical protein JWN11_2563 [Hyphomicrobiales bacterium]|nr:hypothetical protein [Hyphomicrobiales bacterium]